MVTASSEPTLLYSLLAQRCQAGVASPADVVCAGVWELHLWVGVVHHMISDLRAISCSVDAAERLLTLINVLSACSGQLDGAYNTLLAD